MQGLARPALQHDLADSDPVPVVQASCSTKEESCGCTGPTVNLTMTGMHVRRRTCVVVLDERDGARRPHAEQAGRAPLAVHQPPVLAAPHGLLQDACFTAKTGSQLAFALALEPLTAARSVIVARSPSAQLQASCT